MDALEGLVTAHPRTTFIGAHVGCCAEDLRWVSRMLDEHPNFHIDIVSRIAELGRRPARPAHCCAASGPRPVRHRRVPAVGIVLPGALPVPGDGRRALPYSPEEEVPPQGRWTVSALDLPADVLEMVYAGNALRLLQ